MTDAVSQKQSLPDDKETVLAIYPGFYVDEVKKLSYKIWACKLIFTTTRIAVVDEERKGLDATLHKLKAPYNIKPFYRYDIASEAEREAMGNQSVDMMLAKSPRSLHINRGEILKVEQGSRDKTSFFTLEIHTTDSKEPDHIIIYPYNYTGFHTYKAGLNMKLFNEFMGWYLDGEESALLGMPY